MDRAWLEERAGNTTLHNRFSELTNRETEVMQLVTAGFSNKEIGCHLGLSETTVKIHRGRVMQKMQANSLPDLVRMSDRIKRKPCA
jgi:FixJ family two-component response regulator